MEKKMSKTIALLGLAVMAVFLPFGMGASKADNAIPVILKDTQGNPIQTAQDIRVSLWNVYKQRPGDINADGSINTNATHYGGFQGVMNFIPDGDGYFVRQTYGLVNVDFDDLPGYPVISPFNAFLQLEFKNQGDPDTSYKIFDFMDDQPWNNVERLLLDSNASYYTLEAGPQTNWNTFVLDANDSATTTITLQFGETLAEQLKWNKTNVRFELSDNLYIDGSLELAGGIDFNLNEAKEMRLENLASAPTCDNGSKGRLYFKTNSNLPYYCNGTVWNPL